MIAATFLEIIKKTPFNAYFFYRKQGHIIFLFCIPSGCVRKTENAVSFESPCTCGVPSKHNLTKVKYKNI